MYTRKKEEIYLVYIGLLISSKKKKETEPGCKPDIFHSHDLLQWDRKAHGSPGGKA